MRMRSLRLIPTFVDSVLVITTNGSTICNASLGWSCDISVIIIIYSSVIEHLVSFCAIGSFVFVFASSTGNSSWILRIVVLLSCKTLEVVRIFILRFNPLVVVRGLFFLPEWSRIFLVVTVSVLVLLSQNFVILGIEILSSVKIWVGTAWVRR